MCVKVHVRNEITLVFSSVEEEVGLGHLSVLEVDAFSLYGLISEITYPL